MSNTFLAPRRCMMEPIDEVWAAARLLHDAADAHFTGDRSAAARLIREADNPVIWALATRIMSEIDQDIQRKREISDAPPLIPESLRPQSKPKEEIKNAVRTRDGHFCRFCGIPVVDPIAWSRIRKLYPEARWGSRDRERHAAVFYMWLQYDHVLPNSRGGPTTLDNLIITCGPCNFGRNHFTLEQVGLINPRTLPAHSRRGMEVWDGLDRFGKSCAKDLVS